MEKRRRQKLSETRRDALVVATRPRVLASPVPLLPIANRHAELTPLVQLEDRRTYGFPLDRPPRTLRTARPQLVVRAPNPLNRDRFAKLRAFALLHVVSFKTPRSLALCIRRKTRRQVIHAFGLAGRKGSVYHPRRTAWSAVSCS